MQNLVDIFGSNNGLKKAIFGGPKTKPYDNKKSVQQFEANHASVAVAGMLPRSAGPGTGSIRIREGSEWCRFGRG